MTIALSGRQLLQTQSAPPVAGYLPAWAIWQELRCSAAGWSGLLLVSLAWLWRHATDAGLGLMIANSRDVLALAPLAHSSLVSIYLPAP